MCGMLVPGQQWWWQSAHFLSATSFSDSHLHYPVFILVIVIRAGRFFFAVIFVVVVDGVVSYLLRRSVTAADAHHRRHVACNPWQSNRNVGNEKMSQIFRYVALHVIFLWWYKARRLDLPGLWLHTDRQVELPVRFTLDLTLLLWSMGIWQLGCWVSSILSRHVFEFPAKNMASKTQGTRGSRVRIPVETENYLVSTVIRLNVWRTLMDIVQSQKANIYRRGQTGSCRDKTCYHGFKAQVS